MTVCWHPYEVVAKHAAICVCGRGIVKGRSAISPLPVPLPPDPDAVMWYRGTWWVGGVQSPRGGVRRRTWIHRACAAKLTGLSDDALTLLAEDRADELRDKRRRAIRDDHHERGTA